VSYLELTKKLAGVVANRQPKTQQEASAFDLDAGNIAAVKLAKTVIGDVWLVADDDALADHPDIIRSGLPVFLFSEVEQLRGKTPAELKAIGMVKAAFPRGRVLQ
jgi:hypothetical protein